jgi:hypothetical protein
MVARIPWTMLKAGTFHEHVEDVALIYAAKFRAEAEGEASWILSVMQSDEVMGEVRSALSHALRMAAMALDDRK